MKHFKVFFEPDGKEVLIHEGATVLEAAGHGGIILNAVCGGRGTCGKCRVIVGPGKESVLACQYHIHGDLVVSIDPDSRFFEQKILEHGIDRVTEGSIYKKYSEQYSDQYSEQKIFGVAVDIGTTTIVAKLVDLQAGKVVATEASMNPQIRFGDDVISRINYGSDEKKQLELHRCVIDCLNELIGTLCKKSGTDKDYIYELCAVGNTTMNHILLRYPLSQLGQAPYLPHSVDAAEKAGVEYGLNMNSNGLLYTPANIAGFVGSDITAVAVASDIEEFEGVTVIVDIGTNGEILLGKNNEIYAASCAAGPAMEGARIACGSRATEGAIEAVVINADDIDIDVIGDIEARSICGSGLIDAVAVLLELGVVDATGRFVDKESLREKLPAKIFARLFEVDGQGAFCFAENGSNKVYLSQKDIRETQLAKGAIRTGIKMLQKKFALEDGDIDKILLAGAFGNYIRKESALRIGLLPKVEPGRIQFIGNAASTGAQMMLLSGSQRQRSAELAARIEYVEIASEADFAYVYADSMMF